jgi:hypothetical protein
VDETNVGILFGTAAMLVGLYAALAAVYLWRVRRAKERFAAGSAPPSTGLAGLNVWLTPVLLPGAAFLWLVAAVQLWEGYSAGSWWKAVKAFWPLVAGCYALGLWQKSRHPAEPSAAPDRRDS